MCLNVKVYPGMHEMVFKTQFADLMNQVISQKHYDGTTQETEIEQAKIAYSNIGATLVEWESYPFSEYPYLESLTGKLLTLMTELEQRYPFLLK